MNDIIRYTKYCKAVFFVNISVLFILLSFLRVHSKINYQFWELSRLSGKAWKLRYIKYMSCFHNSAGQDESASKM